MALSKKFFPLPDTKLVKSCFLCRAFLIINVADLEFEITPPGYDLFDRIFPDHAAMILSLTQGLSQNVKQEVIELLKKLGKGTGNR